MLSSNQPLQASTPAIAAKYAVYYGPTFERSVAIEKFENALTVYRFHRGEGIQSKVVGVAGYEPADGDGSFECDGLTEAEREAVELADLELEIEP